jgi:hypothetical protein
MTTYQCTNSSCETVWTPMGGKPTLRPSKKKCPDCERVEASRIKAVSR